MYNLYMYCKMYCTVILLLCPISFTELSLCHYIEIALKFIRELFQRAIFKTNLVLLLSQMKIPNLRNIEIALHSWIRCFYSQELFLLFLSFVAIARIYCGLRCVRVSGVERYAERYLKLLNCITEARYVFVGSFVLFVFRFVYNDTMTCLC